MSGFASVSFITGHVFIQLNALELPVVRIWVDLLKHGHSVFLILQAESSCPGTPSFCRMAMSSPRVPGFPSKPPGLRQSEEARVALLYLLSRISPLLLPEPNGVLCKRQASTCEVSACIPGSLAHICVPVPASTVPESLCKAHGSAGGAEGGGVWVARGGQAARPGVYGPP